MFEKYVLQFDRAHAATAEMLAAKFKYSPELGDTASTDPDTHIERCVYNPNLLILPYLDGKVSNIVKADLRKVIEFTRFRYFTHYDVDYASKEFPVVTDHCSLPIFNDVDEAIVRYYITTDNGFRNIKRSPFIESEWEKKKVSFLPEVEEMYSHFIAEK